MSCKFGCEGLATGQARAKGQLEFRRFIRAWGFEETGHSFDRKRFLVVREPGGWM